jgi:hypothetical protein
MDEARHFPPPWRVVETGEVFRVEDANGQQLVFLTFEDESGLSRITKRLTKDEARTIANNTIARAIAK